MSKQDREEFREDDCPVCGRPVRWMRGADRPECPYCRGQVAEVEAEEIEVLVTWE